MVRPLCGVFESYPSSPQPDPTHEGLQPVASTASTSWHTTRHGEMDTSLRHGSTLSHGHITTRTAHVHI